MALRQAGTGAPVDECWKLGERQATFLLEEAPRKPRCAGDPELRQLREENRNDTLAGGQTIRLLAAIDLCSRECVVLRVAAP